MLPVTQRLEIAQIMSTDHKLIHPYVAQSVASGTTDTMKLRALTGYALRSRPDTKYQPGCQPHVPVWGISVETTGSDIEYRRQPTTLWSKLEQSPIW